MYVCKITGYNAKQIVKVMLNDPNANADNIMYAIQMFGKQN